MDEVDKRRKTKIPIKLSGQAGWLLENATGEQLDFLNRLAKSNDFKLLIGLIDKLRYYNVYSVFEFVAKDDQSLEIFRMYKKGELAGLEAIIMAGYKASEEIKRRKAVKV